MPYVHLHCHSDYSFLDGMSKIKDLATKAKSLNQSAIALTDHGVMHGAIQLVKACQKEGIKPIIGNEMYIINGTIADKAKTKKFHLTVLAKNTQGYKNLCKLTSVSHLRGKLGAGIMARPCIDKDLLVEYHEGLIVTSGCLAGEIPQLIMSDELQKAYDTAKWYKDLFGDDFYIEIQDHGLRGQPEANQGDKTNEDSVIKRKPNEADVNPKLVQIARDLGVKIIATNDSHFSCADDKDAHDVLLCVQTGKKITDKNRMRYTGTEYLKSEDEMLQLFGDHLDSDTVHEAVSNTQLVAEKVEAYDLFGKNRMPKFPLPQGVNADDYLRELAWKGLRDRFDGDEPTKEYCDRLEYELEVLISKGFAGYFLVVWDYVKYAKDGGIPVGVARGCVLPGTQVLLANGQRKPIEEISKGDVVVTHTGNHGTVTDYAAYPCNESIVKIKCGSEELSLTSDHKVFALKTSPCTLKSPKAPKVCKPTCTRHCSTKPYLEYAPSWIPAGELSEDDFIVFPRNFSKPEKIVFDLAEELKGTGVKYNETHVWHERGSNHLVRTKIPRFIEFDDKFAKFLGYFIAEGFVRTGENEATTGFGFCSDEEHYVEECKSLINEIFELKATHKHHATRQSIQVFAYSKPLAQFLEKICSKGSNHIHIPNWIVQSGEDTHVKTLLGYLFRGDGSADKGQRRIKYTTTSLTLASQVKLLLGRFGFYGSLAKDDRSDENSKWNLQYYVAVTGKQLDNWNEAFPGFKVNDFEQKFSTTLNYWTDAQNIYVKINKISRQDYNGLVFDISVPGDTSYVANGMAIHNSAGGSLVSYSLKITNIDPVHHGLLFERFISIQRMSLPDIDTDFCIKRRGEIVQYVTEKYGKDRVTQIGTVTQMKSRSVIKDVGRVLDVPFMDAQRTTELIPVVRGNVTELSKMIDDGTPSKEFRQRYESDPSFKHWVDLALKIENVNKTSGVHAAGVVISPEPLDEIVPLTLSSDGNIVTQYDDGDIEELGLLKMDFLGLRNLTIINDALGLLAKKGVNISEKEILDKDVSFHPEWGDKLPDDVRRTYKMMCEGKLDGVFQMESSGMRGLIKEFKPSSFAHLSIINALYRPGILDNGMLPVFIKRKNGLEEIDYPHPCLEEVLKDSFGIPAYQEQIMKAAQIFSGYSLAEADNLRKAMGKKDKEKMAKEQTRFVEGAIVNNIPRETAERVFGIIEKYSSYVFNLSHSMAYGYIAFITAYLKANHPIEFLSALLTGVADDTEKIPQYVAATKADGIDILPPHINKSFSSFQPEDKNIRYGLAAIRNISQEVAQAIEDDRTKKGEYKSLTDFCDRLSYLSLDSRQLGSLILSGAFDSLQPNRKQSMEDLEGVLKWAKSKRKEETSNQLSLFADQWDIIVPPKGKTVKGDYSEEARLEKEKEALGFYLGETPVTKKRMDLSAFNIVSVSQAMNASESVVVIGTVTKVKEIQTKHGQAMAFIELSDEATNMDAVIFPGVYEKFCNEEIKDAIVLASGNVEDRNERKQLVIKSLTLTEKIQSVVVVHLLDLSHSNHLRGTLKRLGKDNAVPTAVFHGGNFVCSGAEYWISPSEINAVLQAGFYAVSLDVSEVEGIKGLLSEVEKLAQCETEEDLARCGDLPAEFKLKVWAACPGVVKARVKALRNTAKVA